jgi:Hemingway/CFA97
MRDAKSCLETEAKGSLHQQGLIENKKTGGFARNFKKEALMEARFTEIERENRLLLEKMISIMKNGNMHNGRPATVPPKTYCK